MRDLIDDHAELDDEEDDESFGGDGSGDEEPRKRERGPEGLDDSSEEEDDDDDEEEARKVSRAIQSATTVYANELVADIAYGRSAKDSSSTRMRKMATAILTSANGDGVKSVGEQSANKKRFSTKKILI